VWSGFTWLRIGIVSGLLWMRWWTFGFWRHGVSWYVCRHKCFAQICRKKMENLEDSEDELVAEDSPIKNRQFFRHFQWTMSAMCFLPLTCSGETEKTVVWQEIFYMSDKRELNHQKWTRSWNRCKLELSADFTFPVLVN
jgi:hypothetical protein